MNDKHLYVIDSFNNEDDLLSIYRTNVKDLEVVIKPGTDEILYMETPSQRIISCDQWTYGKNVRMKRQDLCDFISENGQGYAYHSPSAFALSLFKTLYSGPFEMIMDGFKQRMCYEAVYGGRCEVIKFGTFDTYEYDINSSYPYAATCQTFPDPRKLQYCRGTIDNIWRYDGVSRIEFSQSGWLPILPIRFSERVYYAECNHAIGTYTHTEIRHAIESGITVHKVQKQYYTASTLRPFDEFVSFCFARRSETGNKVWKRVACALFGRLSIRPGKLLHAHPAMDKQDFVGKQEDQCRKHGIWLVGEYTNAQRGCNPLWSAMVLAKARTRLYNIAEKDRTLYMDTDCVFRDSKSDLPISNDLGGFKERHGSYEIRGAKLYKTDRDGDVELVMKGISTHWRDLAKFTRSRHTQERYKYNDGTTRPYTYSEGILQ